MLGFDTLRDRLLHAVRDRVRNGELTERGLARTVGLSQPHIHNILKGIRTLNAVTSDQLLHRLGIGVLDLVEIDELRRTLYLRLLEQDAAVEIPVLKSRLGPGLPMPEDPSEFERVKVPVTYLSRVRNPVVARLGQDPEMAPVLSAGDLVLLDCGPTRKNPTAPDDVFAIERAGEVVARWIRGGRHRHYMVSAATRDEPHRWETFPRGTDRIRARVIPLRWMHRREFLYDPLLPPRDTPREPALPSFSN